MNFEDMTKEEYAQYLIDNDQSMDMKVLNFHKWDVEEVMEIIYHIKASEIVTEVDKQAIKLVYENRSIK